MELPDLKYDYSHSFINGVRIGPRREVVLSIQVIEWTGQSGKLSTDKSLRFGGVVNFGEVEDFFTRHQTLELAHLHYSTTRHSKRQSLYVELRAERMDAELVIQCSNIEVL